MTLSISLLVLLAAALHAGWNAMLRAGGDRLWSMTIMCIAIALACGVLAFIVPMPARPSWGYSILSALLHVGYNLCLVRTYRSGDLGQTYPIARGSSPLLVSLGAALFAGELPDPVSILGVVLVSLGILSLAFQGRRISTATLPYALATGCFIGAYSVVDGIGGRLSGTPIGYTVWMCLLWGVLMPPVYALARNWRSLLRGRRETLAAAGGGLVSLLAYGIVIDAMARGPMGPVSALRETSVVFAALFGWLFLRERLTVYRMIACGVIAVGALCIGHDGTARHSGAATKVSRARPFR
jgi:drug/metabolite transporter (DMT)-like permease